ncbi:MAG: DNA polymerase IV, partial [Chloroflexota bacterium]|nr:DNA polymerase IV [Chloroflexota bacterium]
MILHCDLDAFYASVEQILHPELAGKPVIVGGDPHHRGVVAAASYEARAFGVHSAMPLARALRLCPDGVFVPSNFTAYRDYSQRVFAIYHARTPLVEPLSLDEAYLDLAGTERSLGSSREVALDIKQQVRSETGLTVSIGIASCKVVAKIASDLRKPDGLVEVPLGTEADFLAPLPLRRLPGLGSATDERLKPLGLITIGDLAALPIEELLRRLGKHGLQLWEFSHGIDQRPVTPPGKPKSISRETTFDSDVSDVSLLERTLRHLLERATRNMRENGLHCRTVNLRLRYANFETISRSHTLPGATDVDQTIVDAALQLFRDAYDRSRRVRLVGAGVSNFDEPPPQQLDLFGGSAERARPVALTNVLDKIRDRHGFSAISVGGPTQLDQRDWR